VRGPSCHCSWAHLRQSLSHKLRAPDGSLGMSEVSLVQEALLYTTLDHAGTGAAHLGYSVLPYE